MARYFMWEGQSHDGQPYKGVVEVPSHPDDKATDPITEKLMTRLRNRVPVHLIGYKSITIDEFNRAKQQQRSSTRRVVRITMGAIGIAGCSAASLLLPMPVAIWAASAFAALTVSAAVPP
jgi:hypothetical protein